MLPLDPQGLREATTGPAPIGHTIGQSRHTANGRPRIQPARLIALLLVLVAFVAAAAGGVVLGSALQDRLEARPTAAQTTAFDELSAPQTPSAAEQDTARGPNRADLGGGR